MPTVAVLNQKGGSGKTTMERLSMTPVAPAPGAPARGTGACYLSSSILLTSRNAPPACKR